MGTALEREFVATLVKSPAKGGWTYLVWPESVEYFGTRVGHHYEMLGALRGQHKRLEPVLVTLTNASEVFPLFQHPGTELLYMLEGEMVYGHGESEYRLKPGDALLLDGEGLHGPNDLVELPIRFLAITAYPDNHQG